MIAIDANDRNGEVISMKLVDDADELMMITQAGIIIRTRVDEIRETGRNAAGVRLIKVDDGDKLVAMAKVDREEVVVDEVGDAAAADAGDANEPGSIPPAEPTSDDDAEEPPSPDESGK